MPERTKRLVSSRRLSEISYLSLIGQYYYVIPEQRSRKHRKVNFMTEIDHDYLNSVYTPIYAILEPYNKYMRLLGLLS